MKQKRNQILQEIKKKLKQIREQKIDKAAEEIENTIDDAKMFKAVKQLKRKRAHNEFVHDEGGKNVTDEQEMHNIKRNYFQQQFYNETVPKIEPFRDQPSALIKPITASEVEQCTNRMSNNKSAGDNSIPVELIKYGPPELKSEIPIY